MKGENGTKPEGVKPKDAPQLEGWLTMTAAADVIGISRQTMNKMMNRGFIKTLHQLPLSEGSRSMYLMHESEAMELGRQRDGG